MYKCLLLLYPMGAGGEYLSNRLAQYENTSTPLFHKKDSRNRWRSGCVFWRPKEFGKTVDPHKGYSQKIFIPEDLDDAWKKITFENEDNKLQDGVWNIQVTHRLPYDEFKNPFAMEPDKFKELVYDVFYKVSILHLHCKKDRINAGKVWLLGLFKRQPYFEKTYPERIEKEIKSFLHGKKGTNGTAISHPEKLSDRIIDIDPWIWWNNPFDEMERIEEYFGLDKNHKNFHKLYDDKALEIYCRTNINLANYLWKIWNDNEIVDVDSMNKAIFHNEKVLGEAKKIIHVSKYKLKR